MNLATRYLGIDLAHPILPGASPLVDDLGAVRALEDAGAPAIVMYSLFEEQVGSERFVDVYEPSIVHALPPPGSFRSGPDGYLERIREIREATSLPVVGSLNGTSPGGWVEYAELIEQAGAAAIELNVYEVPGDPADDGAGVERRCVDLVREVTGRVGIPVAVKLSPYYTSLPSLAARLADSGARALVLFNRFFQPDIDVDARTVRRSLRLSDPSELLLRLRWLAILSGRVDVDLGCSGGIDGERDVVKALMAGATTVQTVSALLRHGPGHLRTLRDGLSRWLESRGHDGVAAVRGTLDLARAADPSAYERANYVAIVNGDAG